jgi:hypothetical protein
VARDQPMLVAPEWIERHCVVPDGFRKGAPFELYDYQLRYLAAFYLVKGTTRWDQSNPVLGPAFVYRRGLLIGPQKVGKGPHTAGHVCLEGVGPALFAGWAGEDDGYVCADWGCRCGWEYPYEPGEPMGMPWPTPLIQITAFSEEQTDNIYDALRPMIDEGPLHDVIPKTGEEFIRLPGGGRIDTVTSSAQSRLGQRVTFVPQDEVGIWTPQNKMTKVADTQYRGLAGMGGRASLTSNAYDPSEKSIAQRENESSARDVYRQFDQPPRNLSYRNKRDRAKIHRVVYPRDTWRENGGHVDLNAIEAEAADLLEHDEPQAKRFFGNIITRSAGHAVDPHRWAELTDASRVVADGERVGIGFDGSISEDATALVGCTADGHLFVPTHWVDGEERPTIWLRPEKAPKGWKMPRLEIERAVQAVFARYDVGRWFGDPPKWQTEQERWAEEHGEEVVLFLDTNQPKRMSMTCDRFTTALGKAGDVDRDMTHDGNPLLEAHIVAMVRKKAYVKVVDESDGRTRYVFTKGDDGRKIDAGIAAVLALEAAMTMPETPASLEPLGAWV